MFCKKGMAIFLTAVCFCMSFSVSTIAETTDSFIIDEVSPAYEIAYNSTSSLTINDKMAYCISKAKGNNVVSITVEQTLEKSSG